jgi:SM-20-related protein
MTPKQILDSFSTTLMQDDRILSAPERALLSNLLQHARAATAEDPGTHAAVQRVVAAAVGETVAQRAFSILGASIVERILESGPSALNDSASAHTAEVVAKQPQPPARGPMQPAGQPQPPGSQPQPPGISQSYDRPRPTGGQPQPPGSQPQPPGAQPQPPGARPASQPQPPGAQPQPPGQSITAHPVSETPVALAERPEVLSAKCVVLDEFLAPQELEELIRFTLEHESEFSASEVVSPIAEGGVVNYEHRRSRVLMDLGHQQNLMLARIKSVLPLVLEKLEMEVLPITDVEAQITASNNGDFFRFHSDNGSDKVARRYLTFVYFFHREPQQFDGGELRIHDAQLEGETYASDGRYQAIKPQQNQIVFFPCELMHEVTAVRCPSRLFADSRFTLNGWLRR